MIKKEKIYSRAMCILLAVWMVIILLSSSYMAYAAPVQGEGEEADTNAAHASVFLQAQPALIQVGQAGAIAINAQLNTQTGKAESAAVQIRLDKEEVSLFSSFAGQDTVTSESGVPIKLETQADGSAVLRFQLDALHPDLQHTFAVSSPQEPLVCTIGEEDIEVSVVLQQGVAGEPVVSKQGCTLTIEKAPQEPLPPVWNISLNSAGEAVWETEKRQDISFQFAASSDGTGATPTQEIAFVLTLGQGLSFPQGEYVFEEANTAILCSGVPVVALSGLESGATVQNIQRTQDNSLAFTLLRQSEEEQGLGQASYTIACVAGALLVDNSAWGQDVKISLQGTLNAQEGLESQSASAETLVHMAEKAPPQLDTDPEQPEQQPEENNEGNLAEQVRIDEYHQAYEQTILWVDNQNEEGIRPQSADALKPTFSFALNGSDTFTELTPENLAQLGMTDFPIAIIDFQYGVGSYLLRVAGETLPSKITYIDRYGDETSHTVQWRITAPQVPGYICTEVTDENHEDYPSAATTGWYYVLKSDFTFRVQMRWGDLGSAPGITEAIFNALELAVKTSVTTERFSLNDLRDFIDVSIDPSEDPDNPTSATLKIGDIWKYNLDGSRITLTVETKEGIGNGLVVGNLPEGDYFALSFDNTGAPGFGSVTDKVHDGGTLYLTLTGTRGYEAQKVWLDNGDEETVAKRPTGQFQLWRYREGQSYTSAAPVRNADGTIMTVALQAQDHAIVFEDLPKYDSEGYEYRYVVREYLDSTTASGDAANNYEQILGAVSQTGEITDWVYMNGQWYSDPSMREQGNTYLYNGGTLSNRITDTVPTSATKVWKASAFQAQFGEVKVQLTLQSRRAGSQDAWQDTDVNELLDEFYAENLATAYVSRNMPKYDVHGKELEYRWIESAVYQGESGENLFVSDGKGGGTLRFAGRRHVYQPHLPNHNRTGAKTVDGPAQHLPGAGPAPDYLYPV